MTYKFTDPANTACFVCNHVLNKQRSISYVTHEAEDGFWQFLCGQNDHPNDEDYKVISLEQVITIDASVNDLYDMPLGIGATRNNQSGKWEPFNLN
ncbi:immunity protein Imm33 domain-containing protein [Pedobacter paludis]|uniref:Immunity protein Imm33 domain-containing protein n=1 Tax=Pedobacter paludis TaxID=2203212 RepID=A0A317F740_9SPHI|nr:DUF2185 domain-containing protein [Pedobacter paludis]PWS33867.1 hypothetical protein DF947_04460 [Pedobacter paludis]